MNILNTLHAKYDTFTNDKRLLILLAFVVPAAIANGIAHLTTNPAIMFASLAYLCLLLASRLFYLSGKRKGVHNK